MELFIPIALILAGLVLIAIEVYLVPGVNVVGIIGLVLMVFAVGYVFTESGFLGGTVALIGSMSACGLMFWAMWRSGAWERFVLSTSLRRDPGDATRESEQRSGYLGKHGVAITPLRPTGIAEIEGRRIEVVTEGEFIAAGSRIRVVAMDRRRYFVRFAESTTDQGLAS